MYETINRSGLGVNIPILRIIVLSLTKAYSRVKLFFNKKRFNNVQSLSLEGVFHVGKFLTDCSL